MPIPIRTILCPVDFSQASLSAADAAAVLSKATAARLVLLHVVNGTSPAFPATPGSSRFDTATPMAEHEHALRERLNALASTLCAKGVQIVQVLLVAGPTVELISRVAEDFGADLIVMGQAARSGLERLTGSVTERTARNSRTPVLACPVIA